MVGNISIGQPGDLPGCAPSQLLHTCSSADHEKLERVLDFIATTEAVSVLPTFFSYSIQNTAATGRRIGSGPAKAGTVDYGADTIFILALVTVIAAKPPD